MHGTKLINHTRELLRNRPRTITYADIMSATGLSRAWLIEFMAADTDNSSVVYVEKLYEFLSEKDILSGERIERKSV